MYDLLGQTLSKWLPNDTLLVLLEHLAAEYYNVMRDLIMTENELASWVPRWAKMLQCKGWKHKSIIDWVLYRCCYIAPPTSLEETYEQKGSRITWVKISSQVSKRKSGWKHISRQTDQGNAK